jgi:demethylmenaquinone methyltransferase/2-methoxy-6-polyprenyl-1,4-benzoquinol methylase
MSSQWTDFDISFIRERYNRIARLHGLLEWLLFVPAGIRGRAARRLRLKPGDRVLEIGCGTGPNLKHLRAAVGPRGHVYGVDLSEGMLNMAKARCRRAGWQNVTLVRADACEYAPPELVDGIIFSLSFNTMPHHAKVLRHAWSLLKPGGRLVVMDAKVPPGKFGAMVLRFIVPVMQATVLGNPYVKPWEHLRPLSDHVEMENLMFSYYICGCTKPLQEAPALSSVA